MALFALKIRPGMMKNGTLLQATGRWADGTLVRFVEGSVRPIGGWQELTASAMVEGTDAYADTFVDSNDTTLTLHSPTGSPDTFGWGVASYTGGVFDHIIEGNAATPDPTQSGEPLPCLTMMDTPTEDDCVVAVTVTFPDDATPPTYYGGVMARAAADGGAGYLAYISNNSTPSVYLVSRDASGSGVRSDSAPLSSYATLTPYRLALKVVGESVSVYVDDVLMLAWTDDDHASGYAGVYSFINVPV